MRYSQYCTLDPASPRWMTKEQEVEGEADCADEYALVAEISETEALKPCNLAEAKKRPDWSLWEKAIHEELETLKTAGTWELVNALNEANVIGLKWVF